MRVFRLYTVRVNVDMSCVNDLKQQFAVLYIPFKFLISEFVYINVYNSNSAKMRTLSLTRFAINLSTGNKTEIFYKRMTYL
jgi:hypothetical protein